jgi:hypothetical protein
MVGEAGGKDTCLTYYTLNVCDYARAILLVFLILSPS